MTDLDRALDALQRELQWARERRGPSDDKQVRSFVLDDWGGLGSLNLKGRDSLAVSIDGDVLFGDQLDCLVDPDYLTTRNPAYLSFRIIFPEADARQVLLLVREDLVKAGVLRGLEWMPAGGALDPGVAQSALSAMVRASESTRRPKK